MQIDVMNEMMRKMLIGSDFGPGSVCRGPNPDSGRKRKPFLNLSGVLNTVFPHAF
jgi:hypothetical protein